MYKVGMGNIQHKYFSEVWPLKKRKLFKFFKSESNSSLCFAVVVSVVRILLLWNN